MRHATLLLFSLACASAWAQWEVPTRLELNGASEADRQVTGLALPLGADHGASVEADRTNATNHGAVTGVNALALALSPAWTAYTPGTRVSFVPQNTNTGSSTLNVNGLGAVPLLKDVNVPLDSGDLRPGLPVHAVYDGVSFQVVNQLYPACPVGFSAVNRNICIADLPNDTLSWYGSVNRCANLGARLCTFQEWLQGCIKLPAFVTTVVDYEWVDSGANYNNMAKNMGWNDTATSGNCTFGSRQVPTTKFRSRCCYDR